MIGFGAVALGRDPNGLANLMFGLGRRLSGVAGPVLADRLPGRRISAGSSVDDPSDDGSGEPVSPRDYVTTGEVGAHAAARG